MNDLSRRIKESLLGKGASLVGFADIHTLPTRVRHSLPSAVSIAVALDVTVIAGIRNGPTLEYHTETNRVKGLLIDLGRYAADMLRRTAMRQSRWSYQVRI
ncbi:MAG: hypothetical protein FJ004_03285 [Chloroflexi bacterium]|nr:hypothetical protein [Chloroflexota bacterium]